MWKDTLVRLAYDLLRPLGVSHDRLFDLMTPRVAWPQWRRILRKTSDLAAFAPRADGQRIGLLSMVGRMPLFYFELALAHALQARGANVEVILCDGRHRPLCSQLTIEALEKQPKEAICRDCIANGRRFLDATPCLRYRVLSELISDDRHDELAARAHAVPAGDLLTYEEDGIALGLAAAQTALRHLRRGTFEGTAEEESVLRRMLHSAMITLEACRALHAEAPYDTVLMSHGLYASWGPAAEFFRQKGVYFATYGEQAKKRTYVVTANTSCRLADISKPFEERWRDRPLSPEQRARATAYLRSRADFREDTLKLTLGTDVERAEVFQRLGLRDGIPVLTLFGNVFWDASAVGRDLLFADIVDWVRQTIDFVASRPGQLQLIIKPHPSEAIRGTRQALADEVRAAYAELPGHIVLLEPTTDINAHSIMRATDVGLVHTSTVGMEMSILGLPVVVASWTHYRGYGFTFDPETPAEYFAMLDDPAGLQARTTPERQELALKYFYVRCFHSWLDLPMVRFDGRRQPYGYYFESLDELLPGQCENLDFICDGILAHRPDFVKD